MIPRVLSLLVVLALGACGSDRQAAEPTMDAPTASATANVPSTTGPPRDLPGGDAALLAGYLDELLVTEPDPARPDYDRETWEEGLDLDGDCVRTRHEVLAEESLAPVTIEDCKVSAGEWVDPLTGTRVVDPTDLEVDHLVALADAHRSGGWRWSAERKAAFANALDDPDHLNAVVSAENQRKADDGPEAYRPLARDSWCWYAIAYARVKVTWELTVTPGQMAGLADLVSSCR